MDDLIAGDHVGGNGEETAWQMLDQCTAEDIFHNAVDACPTGKRDRGQRVITERADISDGVARRVRRLHRAHPHCEGRRGDRSGARSAEPIDDDPCLSEFFVDTEVCEPSSAATRQHQAKRPAGDSAGQSGDTVVVAAMMRYRLQRIPPTGVGFGHRDQVDGALGIGPIKRFGRMGLIDEDDQSIALRDNISSPQITRAAVGHHQNPVIAAFGPVESFAECFDKFGVIGDVSGCLGGRRDHGDATV